MAEKKQKFDWRKAIAQGTVLGGAAVLGNALNEAMTTPKTWSEIYAERLLANAKGPGMMERAAAALPKAISPIAAYGTLAGATALGAGSILKAKKNFDKELEQYTTESNTRQDELIKAIRAQRKK